MSRLTRIIDDMSREAKMAIYITVHLWIVIAALLLTIAGVLWILDTHSLWALPLGIPLTRLAVYSTICMLETLE